MAKEILFRLNAGKIFGMGHLSRNLVLAKIFSDNNYKCKFLIKTDDKNKVLSFFKNRNNASIPVIFLNDRINREKDIYCILQNYDYENGFLILDHYDHDMYYQKALKNAKIQWAQFDFKIKEKIHADIIINPNVGVKASDYYALVDRDTKFCVGEKFSIISEYIKKTEVKSQANRILIAMGAGSYPQEVIDMIYVLVSDESFKFDLISSQNLLNSKLMEFTNVHVHNNPKNIADIYARNHVAIVAGGVTSYELAFLGIPMIVVPYAENQQRNAEMWEQVYHALKYPTPKIFTKIIRDNSLKVILSELKSHFKKGSKIIDGNGAERIVKTIIDHLHG